MRSFHPVVSYSPASLHTRLHTGTVAAYCEATESQRHLVNYMGDD
jgi:hypothetical protein